MIKYATKSFYVLVTDNNKYLIKSDPTCLTDHIHEATMYDTVVVAKRCLTRANDKFNSTGYNGLLGYYGAQARKMGVNKISIAKITIQQYDEIII